MAEIKHATDDTFEEVRALRTTVEQGHPKTGAVVRDHEARHPSAGPQIDHASIAWQPIETIDECSRVFHDLADGTRSQESESL